MVIPSYFGQPLYLWIGMLLGALVILQVGLGKKWIKIPFRWHRRNGWLILFVGAIHGSLAIAAYVFHVKVQS